MNRVSRRRFVAGAVIAFGATPILVAAGCAQPPPTPTSAPPPKPTEAPKPAATTAPATPAAPKPTEAAAAKPTEAAKPTAAAKPTTAPTAAIKGQSIAFLGFSYFVPAAGDLFKKQLSDFGAANGLSATSVDYLNWPDVQAKIAASISAGSGADMFEMNPGWQWLYKDNLVDITDLTNTLAQRGGGFEQYVLNSAPVNGRYLGFPHGTTNAAINYRISWFKEAGVELADPATQSKNASWPDMTWEQYFEVGKKMKAKGHPIGQALGHSTGDPPGLTYPYMWSYGAMEVEKDGKTVAFNKPEFVDAMKRFIQAWKDAFDETGLSWDDNSNNRAFLAGQLGATYNGSSIYIAAKKDQPQIADDMNHMLMPKGPSGRFYYLGTRTFAIFSKSKNVEACKAFLDWWFDDARYGDWFRLQEGYFLQNTRKYADDPIWQKDPKMAPFKEQPKYGRDLGYAGPPNDKAALSFSKYIVVDTFAKAVQSGDAEGAIKWGAGELQKIYGG